MKKGIMAAIMALVFAGGFYGVNASFAAEEGTNLSTAIEEVAVLLDGTEKVNNRLDFMEEFQGELHSRNDLKIERLKLHQQIVEKNDQLIDLTLKARKKGDNKEKISDLKEVKKQIQVVNNDLNDLHKLIKVEIAEFRKLVKNKKLDLAHRQAKQLLSLGEKVNKKLQNKVDLLDEMIVILSE